MGTRFVRTLLVVIAIGALASAVLPVVAGQRSVAILVAGVLVVTCPFVHTKDDPVVHVPDVVLAAADADAETFLPMTADLRALVVGRSGDDVEAVLDASAGILVVGRGALATGLFTAISASFARAADNTDELRSAVSDTGSSDLLDDARAVGMPEGTAVTVLIDDRGTRRGSVVLVPDLGLRPRTPCATIEVTRYGCSLRTDPDDTTGIAITPALPLLELPTDLRV